MGLASLAPCNTEYSGQQIGGNLTIKCAVRDPKNVPPACRLEKMKPLSPNKNDTVLAAILLIPRGGQEQ